MRKIFIAIFVIFLTIPAFAIRTGDIDGVVMGGEYQKVYDSGELAAPATSITISGLNGDAEEDYEIICRTVAGQASGDATIGVRFNGDTGSNYGTQYLYAVASSAGAVQSTGTFAFLCSGNVSVGTTNLFRATIHAKSGFVRTLISKSTDGIIGTTVTEAFVSGGTWNNTSDNITSITLLGTITNTFGIGSRIIILRKNAQAVGMRTGTLDVKGKLKGCFQKVYETTISGFLDSSSNHIMASNGSVVTSTSQSKFGGSSLSLNGTTDYLSTPHSADFQYDGGNGSPFTIDGWVYFTSLSNAVLPICGQYVSGTTYAWFEIQPGSNVIQFGDVASNSWNVSFTCPFTPSTGQWYHLAVVRIDNGNTAASWRIFINGVSQTLTLVNGAWNGNLTNFNTNWLIGYNGQGASNYFSGYIDELRVSKGIARWTSNFTPPSDAYTTDSYTKVLCHFDGIGSATSVTISGLDGNTDVLYKIKVRMVAGASLNQPNITLNGDTGSNYGLQLLEGAGSGVVAVRNTSSTSMALNSNAENTDAGYLCPFEGIIYAKSGYIRTGIFEILAEVGGALVGSIEFSGQVWNNTADNLTSITINSNQTNGLGTGTVIILEAYRPQ